MLAIGGAAGAASFTHVHNVAATHGQPGWLAWADAIVLELMSITSGLELRRRKRTRTSTLFPATVLGCAVTLSLAAQVVEAEPSPIGWIAAAVPALGFLVMVKLALGYTATSTRTGTDPSPEHPPDPNRQTAQHIGPTGKPRSAATVGEQTVTRTVRPSDPGQRPSGPHRRRNTAGRGPSTRRTAGTDEMLPAARRIRDRLAADGRTLTRAALAEALRTGGHTVSNTRLSELLKILKAESSSTSGSQDDQTPTDRSRATAATSTARGGRRPSRRRATAQPPFPYPQDEQEKPDHEHLHEPN